MRILAAALAASALCSARAVVLPKVLFLDLLDLSAATGRILLNSVPLCIWDRA